MIRLSKWWYPSDGETFWSQQSFLKYQARASDFMQKRRYSQLPSCCKWPIFTYNVRLFSFTMACKMPWLVRRKKHIAFLQSHVPTELPTMFLLPLQTSKFKKQTHLPVPRTVRNAHVFTGNLGLSNIEEVILTFSIFLHSLEGLQKPRSTERFSSKILANHVVPGGCKQ